MAGNTSRRTTRRRKHPAGGLAGIVVLALVLGIGVKAWPYVNQQYIEGGPKVEREETKIPNGVLGTAGDGKTSAKKVAAAARKDRPKFDLTNFSATATKTTVTPTVLATATAIKEDSENFKNSARAGRKRYDLYAWAEAATLYEKAVSHPARPKSIAAVTAKAQKARTFAIITEGIEVSPLALASGLYDIYLKGGRKMRARVLADNDDGLQYEQKGIRGLLPRVRLDRKVEVSQAKLDKEKRAVLTKLSREAYLEKDNSLQFYLVAAKALELNFPKEAAKYLNIAHDEAEKTDEKAPKLLSVVQEYWARGLLKEGVWFMSAGVTSRARSKFAELSRKYPNTRAAALGKELLAEAKQENIIELASAKQERAAERRLEEKRKARIRRRNAQTTAPADSGAAEVTPKAPPRGGRDGKSENERLGDLAYNHGLDLADEGKVVASARKSTKLYKKALGFFRKATEHYRQAAEASPGNANLQSKLQDSKKQEYWARKLQRLL